MVSGEIKFRERFRVLRRVGFEVSVDEKYIFSIVH